MTDEERDNSRKRSGENDETVNGYDDKVKVVGVGNAFG